MKVLAQELFFAENLAYSSLGTMPMHLPLRAGGTQFCEVTPTYGLVPLSSSGRMPFRQTSLDYSRPGTYGGQYGDYSDEIGYNNMAYPPPPMHHESVDVGYGSGNIPPPQRSFTPGPPLVHKHQNMSFYEPSGAYPLQPQTQQLSHYSGPGQSFHLPLRSSISSPDSHNPYSFQSMAQTLPNPSERALPAPLPASRPASRYDPAMMYGGNTVPSNASTTSPVPSQQQIKSINTSSHLANNGSYMGMSTSPDGTITSNSSFNSADTGNSENDIYASGEWSTNQGLQNTSPTHSSIPSQQHHQLSSQSHTQMAPLPLSTRRSHNDLQNEIDNYNHNTAAHSSNSNHPYNLSNGSVNSLHASSSVNLSTNIQDTASGDTTPQASVPQHPQARKLSHHHSTHFQPVPSATELPSSSGLAGSGLSSNIGTTGYTNTSLSVNGHISGETTRHLGGSLLSNGQAYEPWDGSPPQAQSAQTMNMGRMLEDVRRDLRHRGSVGQGLSGVRV